MVRDRVTGKRGAFKIFTDVFIFLFFIFMLILFLAWALVAGKEAEDFVMENFDARDGDAVLIGLMRTVVNEDLNHDGAVDAVLMADLISLSDDKDLIEDRIAEVMYWVCIDRGDNYCQWIIKIDELRVKVSSDASNFNLENEMEQERSEFNRGAVIFQEIPRLDNSVVRVELSYKVK